MSTQEEMNTYADDVLAYFVGGGAVIGPKTYVKVVAWLKDKYPGISNGEAKRSVSLGAKMAGMIEEKGFRLPCLINYAWNFQAGDTVYGTRTYYDEVGRANGVVELTTMGMVTFTDGNHCSLSSIYKVIWKEAWMNEPATQKQLDLLAAIKAAQDPADQLWVHPTLTKGEASILIELWPKPGQVQCWECGGWFYPKDGSADVFDRWYCGC